MKRLFIAAAVAAMVLLASGCTDHPAVSPAPLPTDPHTASALLKIATVFNHDHDTGNYAPVYARWDASSQAIITRADYIARHKDCPGGSPALSQTESVSLGGPQDAHPRELERHRPWLSHLASPSCCSLTRTYSTASPIAARDPGQVPKVAAGQVSGRSRGPPRTGSGTSGRA